MIYRKNGKFKKIAYDWMKFRKNIMWNVGCKIFMKVEIWKTKKKDQNGRPKKLEGAGGWLILKRILDEIKIRWKKVENLRIMINDTKAPTGKN